MKAIKYFFVVVGCLILVLFGIAVTIMSTIILAIDRDESLSEEAEEIFV